MKIIYFLALLHFLLINAQNSCTKGYYLNSATQTWLACSPGSFSLDGATSCSPCSPGTYNPNSGSNSLSNCLNCVA